MCNIPNLLRGHPAYLHDRFLMVSWHWTPCLNAIVEVSGLNFMNYRHYDRENITALMSTQQLSNADHMFLVGHATYIRLVFWFR